METQNTTEDSTHINIKLILTNESNSNQMELFLEKKILCDNCPFFTKMFNGFKESLEHIIIMKVPDVLITSNILRSFYGHKIDIGQDWVSQSKYYMCYDYLGMTYDLPIKIKVPNESLEELLDLIEIIGYNPRTAKILANNFPVDYDLEKLPLDFLTVIDKELIDFDVIGLDNNGVVSIFDCTIGTVKKIYEHSSPNIFMQYYEKSDELVILSNDSVGESINENILSMYKFNSKTDNYELEDKQSISGNIRCMKRSPTENVLAFILVDDTENKIITYDRNNNKTRDITTRNEIKEICYSHDRDIIYINYHDDLYSIHWYYMVKNDNSIWYRGQHLCSTYNSLSNICYLYNNLIVFNEKYSSDNAHFNFVKIIGPVCHGIAEFTENIIYSTENNVTDIKYNHFNHILIVAAKTIIVYSIRESRVINEIYCNGTNVKVVDNNRAISYGINYPTNLYNIFTGEKIKCINHSNLKELYTLNNVKNYALGQKIKKFIKRFTFENGDS